MGAASHDGKVDADAVDEVGGRFVGTL